jgi:hypothetical protein
MIVACEMDRKCWPGNVKKRRYEKSKALSDVFKFWSSESCYRAEFSANDDGSERHAASNIKFEVSYPLI